MTLRAPFRVWVAEIATSSLVRVHCRAFFPGFPETTAPELIYSSILGSRSDKPDQFDHTTADFQNTLQTLGLTWFGGVSATSGVAFFTSTFLRSTC